MANISPSFCSGNAVEEPFGGYRERVSSNSDCQPVTVEIGGIKGWGAAALPIVPYESENLDFRLL